ncbi:MAG: bacillithiol system redox-active protein YtxJ [Vicingaceae bacterium]|nr:bacillithiol system redox-active protein YtxJ [Vicingaceae bacterium]
MHWLPFESESDLEQIIQESFNQPVAIFKHSTRCSISSVAKMRLSSSWTFDDDLPIYYLDLLSYRSLSDLVAAKFNVFHQSPQLLIIKNGECVYHNSHLSISVNDVKKTL